MSDGTDVPNQPAPTQGFQSEFERLLKAYGAATEAGKTEEATQAAMAAFMMAAEEAIRNPTEDLKLGEAARECEERGDWAGAEAAYRKRLTLPEANEKPGLRAKWEMDLSRLLRLLGRLSEAWELALVATKSARSHGVSVVVVMALENEAACAIDRKDRESAFQAASEAVEVLGVERITAKIRARALALRAECSLANGDIAGANEDLKTSWELSDESVNNLPGPILSRAKWWETQAKLDLIENRLAEAETALRRAISLREGLMQAQENDSPYLVEGLARDYDLLHDISHRRGAAATAQTARSQADHLRRRAHLAG